MNGQSVVASGNAGSNPGAAWHVVGAADFNGDGKADIEWQNTDGTPAVWLMSGFNVISGSNVGSDPGTNWHLVPNHDVLV
jgi:serralysin